MARPLLLIVLLLLSTSAHAGRRREPCGPTLAELVDGLVGKNVRNEKLFQQTDPEHEDFHVTGTLDERGTLRLGMHLEDSRGYRSDINPRSTVHAMLKHFGDKVKRIEWRMSRGQHIDDHVTTVDSQLNAFNKGWREAASDQKLVEKARMTGDEEERRQTIQSRAALSTPVGTSIAFSKIGYRFRVVDKLGKDGELLSATIVYEPR